MPASSLEPMSLLLSEMTKQKHIFGFLRMVPLTYIGFPEQDPVMKIIQDFQGISGDSGEVGREGGCPPDV